MSQLSVVNGGECGAAILVVSRVEGVRSGQRNDVEDPHYPQAILTKKYPWKAVIHLPIHKPSSLAVTEE